MHNEGWVVLPRLPISPAKHRREAWRKVNAAGIKPKHVYTQRAMAERDAKLCTEASGVDFYVTDCIF